jgi:putative polyhydroxyalkanoate system protein
MAEIHIHRKHTLGLAKARVIAFNWAEDVENKLDMACTYEEGKTEDCVSFTRSGVNGTLMVTKDGFELKAKLGFLVGAFKDKIEAEISKNLDALLSKSDSKPTAKLDTRDSKTTKATAIKKAAPKK